MVGVYGVRHPVQYVVGHFCRVWGDVVVAVGARAEPQVVFDSRSRCVEGFGLVVVCGCDVRYLVLEGQGSGVRCGGDIRGYAFCGSGVPGGLFLAGAAHAPCLIVCRSPEIVGGDYDLCSIALDVLPEPGHVVFGQGVGGFVVASPYPSGVDCDVVFDLEVFGWQLASNNFPVMTFGLIYIVFPLFWSCSDMLFLWGYFCSVLAPC